MGKLHLSNETQRVFQAVECAAKKRIRYPYRYQVGVEKQKTEKTEAVILSICRGEETIQRMVFCGASYFKDAKIKIREVMNKIIAAEALAA